jgi:hypothetical protein
MTGGGEKVRKTTNKLLKGREEWMELSVDEWEKMSNREAVLRREIFELEQTKKTMTEMLRKLEEEKRLLVAEKEQLATENAHLHQERNALVIDNAYLRNMLLLSGERIKEFMKRVKRIDLWSFLRTFVEWSLPEKGRKEQLELMDEVMVFPQNENRQLVMQNPTFHGPMYDVHDNQEVKLDE